MPRPEDGLEAVYSALRYLRPGESADQGYLAAGGYYLDRVRYETQYGEGSFDRDRPLIADGVGAIVGRPIPPMTTDGFLVSLEVFRAFLETADHATPGLHPIYDAAISALPPAPPDDHVAHPAWKGLLHEALRAAWKREGGVIDLPTPPFIRLSATTLMLAADEDYLIGDGVLTRGGKLMLYAYAGAGKTTLLDFMAASLACGRPFLGVHEIDRPHVVLYVQGELTEAEIASHGRELMAVYGQSDATENLVFWRNTQLPLPEAEDRLRDAIRDTGATILILDPFNRFFRGDNSMTQEQVGEVFRMIDRLLEDPELGLEGAIVSHHMNVSRARMAGTYDFEGWPSTILRLDALTTDGPTRKLTYEKVRAPGSTYLGRTALIELGESGYLYSAADAAAQPTAGPILVRVALQELGGEAFRRDLINRSMVKTGSKERAVSGYVSAAVTQGLIERVAEPGTGRQALYRLVPRPEDTPDAD